MFMRLEAPIQICLHLCAVSKVRSITFACADAGYKPFVLRQRRLARDHSPLGRVSSEEEIHACAAAMFPVPMIASLIMGKTVADLYLPVQHVFPVDVGEPTHYDHYEIYDDPDPKPPDGDQHQHTGTDLADVEAMNPQPA